MKRSISMCGLAALAVGVARGQGEITMPTEKGTITLLMKSLTPNGNGELVLDRLVRNGTPFRVSSLMLLDVKKTAPGLARQAAVRGRHWRAISMRRPMGCWGIEAPPQFRCGKIAFRDRLSRCGICGGHRRRSLNSDVTGLLG